ncbi:MAG TPA: carbamoyltransferase HypF [Chloroflexota bacterium]
MTGVLPHERRAVAVRGIVQGVGFRPFVYALARRHGLTGMVRNDTEGVRIEAEGPPGALEAFLRDLEDGAPPLAVVETVSWDRLPPRGEREFRIETSRDGNRRQALVSPDVATCVECLRELFDPSDRRHRYPFINCTNCGPRFTITKSVPYDRETTTMSAFTMCQTCLGEYTDPSNRRFHAQPNACPECGPHVRLVDRAGVELPKGEDDPIRRAAWLLRDGAVVAVKGLGGYHLACDPFNRQAVWALRQRKVRQDKPFALMARDLEQVRSLCDVSSEEASLLTAPGRPIVLLSRREGSSATSPSVAEEAAPRQQTLGMMLAYTPVHHLLLHDVGTALIMTSGNRSDEPIAYRDDEAFEQLGAIADYFLIHDRPIHMRCDDSVVRNAPHGAYPVRRSRGYAPAPLRLAQRVRRPTLACGGELKNTFCLTRDHHAFLSHHIGDLENFETLRSFREGIEHYCRVFDIRPELVAYDLHPDYLSTKYARELEEEEGLPAVGVQHHHAHIAACLADNQRPLSERVIGVVFDGTGYGLDGTVWGGEFFEGSIQDGFTRRGHLEYAALPGGAMAIRQPWRSALAQLLSLYTEEEVLGLPLGFLREVGEHRTRAVCQMIRGGVNTPLTSSAGRLFDAVASLVGAPGTIETTYEGQAAVELELMAGGCSGDAYPLRMCEEADGWVLKTGDIIAGVVHDLLLGLAAGEIAARFHRTIAEIVVMGCRSVRQGGGPQAVALSGGTFQNMLLLRTATELLRESDFTVYLHQRVPPNDGGLSLGQAVLADSAFGSSDG